ncbi:MAG: pentapeptide repeat-containing protein [Polyangiales bacterium]
MTSNDQGPDSKSNDVELGATICELPGITVQQGSMGGSDVTCVVLQQDATATAKETFERIRKFSAAGGASIVRAGGRGLVLTPPSAGTLAYMPSLGWRLAKRLDVFVRVLKLVHRIHEHAKQPVGPLDPSTIMLAEDLRPFLLGPRIAKEQGLYAAPETIEHGALDIRSDVFSLGRLLHFTILQEDPPPAKEDPPRLDSLMTFPAGLSRIVRKATMRDRELRYASPKAMLADLLKYGRYEEVGIAHLDVKELNFAGLSQVPPSAEHSLSRKIELEELRVPKIAQTASIDDFKPFALSPRHRWIALGIGVAAVLFAFTVNYFAGDPLWVRALLSVCAGIIGFSIFPSGIEKEQTLRMVFGCFFAFAMFAWNPTSFLAELSDKSALRSSDAEARVASFQKLRKDGTLTFTGVDLSGASLHDESFFFITFRGGSLANADLTKASFVSCKLSGVDMAGANLTGTSFALTPLDEAINLDQATCDSKTTFPKEWACVGGKPVKSH